MIAPAERLRRTWPQRLLITFNVVLIVGCLTAAGGLGYFYYQFGNLPRIDLPEDTLADDSPGEPQNFLLVGSDSRAFVEQGSTDERSFGRDGADTGGQRADTIILVRVDPQTRRAAMVSFPRDLWVPIAPDGHQQRINTAFARPEQLIQTIQQDFNIPIHHYAQVDFKGFQGLVDAVGGVRIYLASPVRDRVTGLNILDTGCVELHGDQALSYVRSRKMYFLERGTWKQDGRGDLGRIERQQDFIRRAMREALSKGLTNPLRLNRLVNVGLDNVQVSKSLDARDVVNLGKNFRSLSPETLQQYSLPVELGRSSGGASILRISDEDAADQIFQVFRGAPPAAAEDVQPNAVTVRVLNGSGTVGQAGDTSSALQQAEFTVTAPGDATRTSRTTIRYGEGQEAKARLLERYLVAGAQVVEYPGLQGVDVVLVTGADFDGVLATPRSAEATPPATGPTPNPPPAAPEC